jgi:hypothetical protein
MARDHDLWREIAARHGLVEPDLDRLASPGTPTSTWAARSR